MIKVRILDRCEFCDGEAYIFDSEDVDARGETYDRYRPCEVCQGSGNRANWVDGLNWYFWCFYLTNRIFPSFWLNLIFIPVQEGA
jgi:hypothetical protein